MTYLYPIRKIKRKQGYKRMGFDKVVVDKVTIGKLDSIKARSLADLGRDEQRKMASEQIRIKEDVKKQLDELIPNYIKKVYNDGKDRQKIRKMKRYGLSYSDFIQELIDRYCE